MMHKQGQFLVYLAICLITGLPYVGIVYGKSQTVSNRWQEHCNPRTATYNYRLERAIREHGAENFTVAVIDKAEDRDTLNFKERFYISLYDSFKNGYNGNIGGTRVGHVISEATRQRMRDRLRALWQDPAYRQQMSRAHIGKTLSPEARRKVGDYQRGRKHSEATITKLRAINVGKKLSPEQCAAMSAARQGKPWTPARRAKAHWSEDSRRRLSEVQKGRKRSAESIRKSAEGNRGQKRSEETLRKLSENKKQFYAARRAQAALEAMRGPIAVLKALQGFTLD